MHLIYYGRNGDKAKEIAAQSRANKTPANVRHAVMFNEPEKADKVTILPCVAEYDAVRIERAYPDAEIVKGKSRRAPQKPDPVKAEPIKEPVEIDKSEPSADVDAEEADRRASIDIPDGWETMPFMSKRALARKIADSNEPSVAAEVDAVIASEAARRKG
jgi:hypothetical protein